MTFIHKRLDIQRNYFVVIFLILQVLFRGQDVLAQEEKIIQQLEQFIRPVESKIMANEYYLNEHKINAKRFSLHQPGYFQYFERYYFTPDKRPGKNREILLKSVITRIEKEEKIYFRKYIFDDEAQLIYYTEREADVAEAPQNETRVYIYKNQLIKYMSNAAEEDKNQEALRQKTVAILDEALQYQQKFKEQMQNIQYY